MPNRKQKPRKQPPTFLILVGIVILLLAAFVYKSSQDQPASAETLEKQLDIALESNRPAFVFLHSLDCIPCQEMMGVVAQVYPEFQDKVVLIDVDVYNQANAPILRRERLQAIPTQVFYTAGGMRQYFVGVMTADQLRQTLQSLQGN